MGDEMGWGWRWDVEMGWRWDGVGDGKVAREFPSDGAAAELIAIRDGIAVRDGDYFTIVEKDRPELAAIITITITLYDDASLNRSATLFQFTTSKMAFT